IPTIAPMVLKRRHHSASSRPGKVTLDAKQNASPTSTETLNSAPPANASTIASTPMTVAEIFATQTPSRSESAPSRTTFAHRSCATPPRSGDHEARDDGEDRRERDRGDHCEEDVAAGAALAAAELLGERRDREVAGLARGLLARLAEDRPG